MTASGTSQTEVGGPADLGVALATLAAAATPHQDAGTGPVLVASDFDGVLAPLGDDPLASRPTPAAAAALAR
ncbi:hypothetical protein DLJ96_12365, partial [Actinotalea fermentans ATCC 43279 = JCM 9966 = DSM 3133]